MNFFRALLSRSLLPIYCLWLINELFKMACSNKPLDLILQSYTSVCGMPYILMKSTIPLYISSSSFALYRLKVVRVSQGWAFVFYRPTPLLLRTLSPFIFSPSLVLSFAAIWHYPWLVLLIGRCPSALRKASLESCNIRYLRAFL